MKRTKVKKNSKVTLSAQGIIITKVDRIPDSCLDCEMHDDVLWCPYAGEYVEIYANECKKNPRCPIRVDEQEKNDGK